MLLLHVDRKCILIHWNLFFFTFMYSPRFFHVKTFGRISGNKHVFHFYKRCLSKIKYSRKILQPNDSNWNTECDIECRLNTNAGNANNDQNSVVFYLCKKTSKTKWRYLPVPDFEFHIETLLPEFPLVEKVMANIFWAYQGTIFGVIHKRVTLS